MSTAASSSNTTGAAGEAPGRWRHLLGAARVGCCGLALLVGCKSSEPVAVGPASADLTASASAASQAGGATRAPASAAASHAASAEVPKAVAAKDRFAWSPDQSLLAWWCSYCKRTEQIRVVDAEQGKLLGSVNGDETTGTRYVGFGVNNTRLVTSTGTNVTIFGLPKLDQRWSVSSVWVYDSARISPNGDVVIWSTGYSVSAQSVATGAQYPGFDFHDPAAAYRITVHWSPDGSRALLAHNYDGVALVDAHARKLAMIHLGKKSTGGYTAVWHPSGKRAFVMSMSDGVAEVDGRTGRVLRTLHEWAEPKASFHHTVTLSPDGETLALHAGALHLWDKGGHRTVGQGVLDKPDVEVDKLVFSPDGAWLAGADDKRVFVINVKTGKVARSFSAPAAEGEAPPSRLVGFSAAGKLLFTRPGALVMVTPSTGEPTTVRSPGMSPHVALSPAGDRVAWGTSTGAHVLALASGEQQAIKR